jgi:hypothetical protein
VQRIRVTDGFTQTPDEEVIQILKRPSPALTGGYSRRWVIFLLLINSMERVHDRSLYVIAMSCCVCVSRWCAPHEYSMCNSFAKQCGVSGGAGRGDSVDGFAGVGGVSGIGSDGGVGGFGGFGGCEQLGVGCVKSGGVR